MFKVKKLLDQRVSVILLAVLLVTTCVGCASSGTPYTYTDKNGNEYVDYADPERVRQYKEMMKQTEDHE